MFHIYTAIMKRKKKVGKHFVQTTYTNTYYHMHWRPKRRQECGWKTNEYQYLSRVPSSRK